VGRNYWKTYINQPFNRMWVKLSVRRLLWGFVFFSATTILLGVNFIPKNVSLEVGQPSPRNFEARMSINYASEVKTELARQEAANQVKPVYKVDEAVLRDLGAAFTAKINAVRQVKSTNGGDMRAKAQRLKEELGNINVPLAALVAALDQDEEKLDALERDVLDIINRVMGNGIQLEAVEPSRVRIMEEVGGLGLDEHLGVFVKGILSSLDIQPNLVYDMEGTARMIRLAQEAVTPVFVDYKKNQKIVGQGEIVTEAHIEALQRLGELRSRAPYAPLAGLALMVLICYVLVLLYVYQHKKEIYNRESHFVLLGLLLVTTMVFTKGFAAINLGSNAEVAAMVGYLAPVAAGSMLIAILLDTKLAIFSTVIMGFFTGLATGGQFNFAVAGVVSGLAGVYSVSGLSQRGDLARASVFIIVANLCTIMAFSLIQQDSLTALSVGALMGVANGFLSTILCIGSLPFLETAFGITTSVRLLELSNPNHPLLKKMLMEAPGTYHHSVMVGNMAESAADAVGANGLLARVGSYYHDIGKVKRPYFFIENQFAVDNPHDKLAPTLSTLIITSHVKDGLELAREHKLPEVITQIIEQHHGTGLISYFYHKAMEQDRTESILEADFRYETPRPQSKEAAIVLLADSVEAAVRSMQKASPGRMEGMVRRIIKEKLEDGQLENSELTFRELELIAQAFVRVLNGMFHSRIEYPENVLREMERRKAKDAAVRAKSAG